MRYAGLIRNDLAAAPGVCVTVFTQGCHLHCKGCHNQDSWDFNGGEEFNDKTIKEILLALTANGINRTLCIMGGEPLSKENLNDLSSFLKTVKEKSPNTNIWLWSGYDYQDYISKDDFIVNNILPNIDTIIDGPYKEELRDITLKYRGSSNQGVWHKYENGLFYKEEF